MKLKIFFFVPPRNIFKLNLKVYNINWRSWYLAKPITCYISNRHKIRVIFCCCTINVMRETHILETKNVGLYTWRGGGRGVWKSVLFVHSLKCWHFWMAPKQNYKYLLSTILVFKICWNTYQTTTKITSLVYHQRTTWPELYKVNSIPTHCGVTYDSVHSPARSYVLHPAMLSKTVQKRISAPNFEKFYVINVTANRRIWIMYQGCLSLTCCGGVVARSGTL